MDRIKRLLSSSALHALILAVWPLFSCGRGLSLIDPLYALGNYEYFGQLRGTWEVGTFLANAVGFILSRLPGGGTVLGMQIYTSLLVSVFSAGLYYLLKDDLGKGETFLGLFIASSFAWCPTVVLYNWLTMMFLSLGTVFLVKGVNEDDRRRSAGLLVMAGLLFGLNVTVKMPNVIHALMILVLIFDDGKRRLKDFFICLAGWFSGFLVPVAVISLIYGFSSYISMLNTYTSMKGGSADDYKAGSMFTDILSAYADALVFLLPLLGVLLFTVLLSRHLFKKGKRFRTFCYILAYAGMLLWIRFAWGRGMFDFKYYHYNAVYLWGVVFIIMAALLAVYVLLPLSAAKIPIKSYAFAVLLTIIFTPIGSNNALYPVVDCMFLISPFAVSAGLKLLRDRKLSHIRPAALACFSSIIFMMLLQGSLFHVGFALQDGYWGESRGFFSEENRKAKGVSTIRDNAKLIDDLTVLSRDYGLSGGEGIFYGNIPGLSYLLDIRSPLSTIWPSLDTYTMTEWERDFGRITGDMPAVFISDVASRNEKYERLKRYMDENGYTRVYSDNGVSVYVEGAGE